MSDTGAEGETSENLLLADLEHFGDSMWRNEETGEKRFNFFLTLVTAVAGGIITLVTSNATAIRAARLHLTAWAAGVLFVFGVLTYMRILKRNSATDGCLATMKFIRKRLSRDDTYVVPVGGPKPWMRKAGGGFAQMVAVMNGGFFGVFLWTVSGSAEWSVAAGFVVGAGMWTMSVATRKPAEKDQQFRAGAGAWIVDDAGRVLACERTRNPGAWQTPQGGLEEDEEPSDCALREIKEETGISKDRLELVDTFPGPLAYELPPEHRSAKTGRGQVQYWFKFRLRGGDDAVRLPKDGEFRAWRWMTPDELVAGVVAFKRPVYLRVRDEFAPGKGPSEAGRTRAK